MRKATFLQLPTHKFYSRIIQAAFVFITTLLTFTSSAYARKPRGAVAQSGDVLITGGVAGKGGVTNAAEFYRPSAGRFFKTGTMVDARAGHQSFEIGVTPETAQDIQRRCSAMAPF